MSYIVVTKCFDDKDYPEWAFRLLDDFSDSGAEYSHGFAEFSRWVMDTYAISVRVRQRPRTESICAAEVWTFESEEDFTLLLLKAA